MLAYNLTTRHSAGITLKLFPRLCLDHAFEDGNLEAQSILAMNARHYGALGLHRHQRCCLPIHGGNSATANTFCGIGVFWLWQADGRTERMVSVHRKRDLFEDRGAE